MLVGHVGAGLAAKAVQPKLNLGTLLAAALLLDIVFWCLLLLGFEAAHAPPDFVSRRYLSFTFPYSHSLAGAVILSFAFALAWMAWRRRTKVRDGILVVGAIVVGLTVFSHWVLDWLVHVPEMPLVPGGAVAGMGLWRHQPLALVVEIAIALAGLAAFLVRAPMSIPRRIAVAGATVVIGGMTAMGIFGPAALPAMSVMAATSLGIIASVVAVGAWADSSQRNRREHL